jgi:flagellar biogenesis protein FliO
MWMQQAGAVGLGAETGFELLRVALALAGVCALAFVALRWLASRGVGRSRPAGAGRVQVVERLGLDAQRALYLVRAEGRLLLLGTGPDAAPRLIVELAPDETPAPNQAAPEAGGPDRG